ncbi:hypothetical protein TRFO_27207 [Tritrichomonas foetus]|uniref:Tetraspanin family protein n=1 Tax=Tritrichomonas foetus TaxID=1144522 RepID=A0A1J4K663_9EUKA|nr:hypothetical protein TRFO_27207 [Tritrichomonas foetus]|eukprot:OHT05188.1 hypothetical protein TRFO_27207 [Tritrichomonas foetus]
MNQDLREELVVDGSDVVRSSPDELHQMFEDQTFNYYHSKKTTILFYITVALAAADFIILFVEYLIVFRSGKYYSQLSLKQSKIYIFVIISLACVGFMLFIFVNVTAIYQHYHKYFYCTKERLNYYGTMAILLLIIDAILIFGTIIPMREYLKKNCEDNVDLCISQFCGDSADSKQFAIDYSFNVSDLNECRDACENLVENKCSRWTILSYVPVIVTSILLTLSIILTKFVCLTTEKEEVP